LPVNDEVDGPISSPGADGLDEYEEIGTEPVEPAGPIRSPRWTRVAWLVIGLVAAGAAVFSVVHRTPPATSRSAATPADVLGPSASFVPPAQGTQAGPPYVTVGLICEVKTEDGSTLDIAFTLVALTDEHVRIVSVDPFVPFGDLRPLSSAVSAGSCPRPIATAIPPVSARKYLVVTMRLAVPGGCPRADPVMASVHELVDDRPFTDQIAVLSDLGQVAFPSCETG
jgi:hypothetical protein